MAMLTALFRRPAGKQVTWHPHEDCQLLQQDGSTYTFGVQRRERRALNAQEHSYA